MRYLISAATLVAVGLLALPATAQPPGPPGPGERGGRFRDPEFRQRMIEEFDKDGDGRLSDEERQTMRETVRERFGRGGPGGPPTDADRGGPPVGPPPEGAPPEGQPAEPRRGVQRPEGPFGPPPSAGAPSERRPAERRRGVQRSEGPLGPPGGERFRGRRLEPLFDWFDENGDGMLSRGEFHSLAEFAGRHHSGHPGERPGVGRRGPDGAPWGDGIGRRGAEGRHGPDSRPRRDAGPPPRPRQDNPPPGPEVEPLAEEPI